MVVMWLLSFSLLLFLRPILSESTFPSTVCIIGSGIAGSSVAHFIRKHSFDMDPSATDILMFEKSGLVGGRMATVTIEGEKFEAGASILHPKNYYASNFTKLLGLKKRLPPRSESSMSLGIWDGNRFSFKTVSYSSKLPLMSMVESLMNAVYFFLHYGLSIFRMDSFVEVMLNKFLKFYESYQTRPAFETVEGMLKWTGLYNLTTTTLREQLVGISLSSKTIDELATVITRINYGQSVEISGLAGAVSLAGSGSGLWSIEGGNWQLAAGLINVSDVDLKLREEIVAISCLGDRYELSSAQGTNYLCDSVVIATPLDESRISFMPSVSVPERKLQHTHATFVTGLINPLYFGLETPAELPQLIATIENPLLPFTSISVLKAYNDTFKAYKIFSREHMTDALLDNIFSTRRETLRIDWGAYPCYKAPEVFAPFILDGKHLYYVNAFENAASTVETGIVAAENVARLLVSRCYGKYAANLSDHCTVREPLLDAIT